MNKFSWQTVFFFTLLKFRHIVNNKALTKTFLAVKYSEDCILFTYLLSLLSQCAERRAGGCRHSPLVEYVVVPALPRCASVEWQVTAVTDSVHLQGLSCV